MTNGTFKLNPYRNNAYRAGSFNTSPFSLTPYEAAPYTAFPLNSTPFTPTPYTINPYNKNTLYTAYERINYLRDMRLKLPDKKARNYLNRHNSYQAYLRAKQNETPEIDYISDYNNAKQINSLRDVLLGAWNPNMDHAINMPQALAALNIIPDTLMHLYNHYIKPTIKGKPLMSFVNLLSGASEDLDVIANPIKALIISATAGDDVGQALLRATFGDKTGIHNYDYDTGNIASNIILEMVSDPLNFISFGGKGALSTITKSGAKVTREILSETGEQLGKKLTKRVAKDVAKNTVNQAVKETAEDVVDIASKKAYKNIIPEIRRNLLKGMSLDDTIQEANTSFTKRFTKALNSYSDEAFTKASVKFVGSPLEQKMLNKNIRNLAEAVYMKLDNKVVWPIAKTIGAAETVDKAILGFAIPPAGLYMMYKHKGLLKPTTEALQNRMLRKVKQVDTVRVLNNSESFVKATHFDGVNQVIEKERSLAMLYQDLIEATNVQTATNVMGAKLANMYTDVNKILIDNTTTATVKRQAILNVLQSIDSYVPIKSLDDFEEVITELENIYGTYKGVKLKAAPFETHLNMLKSIKKSLNDLDIGEASLKKAYKNLNNVDTARQIMALKNSGFFDDLDLAKLQRQIRNDESMKALLKNKEYLKEINDIIQDIYSGKINYQTNPEWYVETVNYLQKIYNTRIAPFINTMKADEASNRLLKRFHGDSIKFSKDLKRIGPKQFSVDVITRLQFIMKNTSVESFAAMNVNTLTDTLKDFANLAEAVSNNMSRIVKVLDGTVTDDPVKWAQTQLKTFDAYLKVYDDSVKNTTVFTKHMNKRVGRTVEEAKEIYHKLGSAKIKESLTNKQIAEETERYVKELLDTSNLVTYLKEENYMQDFLKIKDAIEKFPFDSIQADRIARKKIHALETYFKTLEEYVHNLFRVYNKIKEGENILSLYEELRNSHFGLAKQYIRFEEIMYGSNKNLFENYGLDAEYLRGLLDPLSKVTKEELAKAQKLDAFRAQLKELFPDKELMDIPADTLEKLMKENKIKTPKISSKDIAEYNVVKPMLPSFNRIKNISERLINGMEFRKLEESALDISADSDIFIAKLEKHVVQSYLDEVVVDLIRDQNIIPYIEHIFDSRGTLAELYNDISPESIELLSILATKIKSIGYKLELERNIEELFGTDLAFAIKTTFAKYSPYKLDRVEKHFDDFFERILKGAQGYVNATDLTIKKNNLDALIERFEITPEAIYAGLKEAGINSNTVGRHDAAYDVMASILVYEAFTGKQFAGVMYDTETTKLLTSGRYTTGKLLEVVAIEKTEDGKLINRLNKKVQLSKETLENYYNTAPNTLQAIDKTKEEYIKYYSKKALTDPDVTEKDLLAAVYELFQDVKQRGVRLEDFNGSEFDTIFLQQKFIETPEIDRGFVEASKKLVVENRVRKNTVLKLKETVENLFKEIDYEDLLQVINKDRYRFTAKDAQALYNVMQDYFLKMDELKALASEYNRSLKVFEGVDGNFVNDMKHYLQYKSPEVIDDPRLKDALELSEELFPGTAAEGAEDFILRGDLLELDPAEYLIEGTNKHLVGTPEIQVYQESLSELGIRQGVRDAFDELLNRFRDVGLVNKYLDDVLENSLYDRTHSQFSETVYKRLMKILKELLPKDSAYYRDFDNLNITNSTQLINMGLNSNIIAYRKLDHTLLSLYNTTGVTLSTEVRKNLDTFARQVLSHYDLIVTPKPIIALKDEVLEALEYAKKSSLILEHNTLDTTIADPQLHFAELYEIIHALRYRAEFGVDTRFSSKEIMDTLYKKFPEVMQLIDNKSPFIKVKLNNTDFIEIDLPKEMLFNTKITEASKDSGLLMRNEYLKEGFKILNDNSIDLPKGALDIQTQKTKDFDDLVELHKASYTEEGLGTASSEYIKRQDIGFVYNVDNHRTTEFFMLPAEIIRNEVVNSGKYRTMLINVPVNNDFNNKKLFNEVFSKQKKALKELNVNWKWDEANNRVILQLDPNVKVELNRNTLTNRWHYDEAGNYVPGAKYVIDGELIPPHIYQPISYEDFHKGFDDTPYARASYKVYQNLQEVYPELRGRLPKLSSPEAYQKNFGEYGKHLATKAFTKDADLEVLEDAYNILDTAVVGGQKGLVANDRVVELKMYDLLGLAHNKITYKTHSYFTYGDAIMNGGMRLNSDWFKKMTNKEIVDMLNKDQGIALVYLADQKHAKGLFELRRISTYTESTIEQAKRLNATIVPWSVYERASLEINKYSYDSKFLQYWAKYVQCIKKGQLISLGTFIRNAIDTTMKNFVEGREVDRTMKSYVDAFQLLNKFDEVKKQIRNMDPYGRYRLDNANILFSNGVTKLDKETYDFVYDFLEHCGMLGADIERSGMFSTLMKPNEWVERTSRLAMFLNLSGQGLEYNEIIRKITQTHFNYNLKTYSDFLLQNVIPFWTYTSNNVMYYLDLMDRNPAFFRNFFNVYTPIWDFDETNFEELAENTSLQLQILNGNIPLKLFGYKDKPIKRIVNTKYGPKEQEVVNTAVLKMGSSVLDAMQFLVNPFYSIKEKLAPPAQTVLDTMTEYLATSFGNSYIGSNLTYEETEKSHQANLGSSSIQAMFRDPSNVLNLVPVVGPIVQRYTHREYDAEGKATLAPGSTTLQRTENALLGMIPSVMGATSRWGKFTEPLEFPKKQYRSVWTNYPRQYYSKRYYSKKYYPRFYPGNPRIGTGVTYRFNGRSLSPYYTNRGISSGPRTSYSTYMYRLTHPNATHNSARRVRSSNLQSIPEYLYSYMGKNRQGKSKTGSWLDMNTRFKVKSTLRRLAR